MTHAEKLKDPRWIAKRDEIIKLAEYRCESCNRHRDELKRIGHHLEVHHKYYEKGREYWDYLWTELICLCDVCHELAEEALQEGRKMLADLDWKDINGLVGDFQMAARRVGDHSLLIAYIRLSISDPGKIQKVMSLIPDKECKEE